MEKLNKIILYTNENGENFYKYERYLFSDDNTNWSLGILMGVLTEGLFNVKPLVIAPGSKTRRVPYSTSYTYNYVKLIPENFETDESKRHEHPESENQFFDVLHIPIFDRYVSVAYGISRKDLPKWVSENILPEYAEDLNKFLESTEFKNGWSRGDFISSDNTEQCIIRLNNDVGIEVITHECLHFVFFAADKIGLRYSKDSEEFYTYLLGYVTKFVTDKIKEHAN